MKFWPLIRLVPRATHFNFVGLAPFAAILSALLIVGSGVSVYFQQVNFGVDFVGGTTMTVATPGPAPLAQIRADLAAMGVNAPEVQSVGNGNAATVRFRDVKGQTGEAGPVFVAQRLTAQVPGLKVTQQSFVG